MYAKWSAARWFCALLAAVLGVRAVSTLLDGADFAIPGTGWRSVWQLIMVAILITGVLRPRWAVAAALTVASVYAMATVSELFDGSTLLAAIPVDSRDRYLHPLFAVIGLASAMLRQCQAFPRGRGEVVRPPS
ncbi:DUF4383 domain-containing protein [Nocardia sp. AG03]|uniref:DUF4383 domain-containing protein n=1 Tax=Nocardia sp. AG03 TaxID=3025312 RepID=UPI0024186312|nr:DUF4383 domain-containing protein [Nocardia sp. AG03]